MSSNTLPNHPPTETNSAWSRLRPLPLSTFSLEIQQMTARELYRLMLDIVSEEGDPTPYHEDRARIVSSRLQTAPDPRLPTAPAPLNILPNSSSITPSPIDLVLSPLPIDDDDFQDADDVLTAHIEAGKRFLAQLSDISAKDIPNSPDCHICMAPFNGTENPESPIQLPCKHILGRACISKWLSTSNTCPLCRYILFDQKEQQQQRQEELPPSPPFPIFHTPSGRPFRTFREPFSTIDIGAVLQRAGLSTEEALSFQDDWSDICWQQASLEVRLVGLETEDRPLPARIAAELEILIEEANGLAGRLGGFWERYRGLIEEHRIPITGRGGEFDLEGALALLDV